MADTVRTRFAPSPTGLLHIGGARTALFNWLYARHTGGKFVLRVEDTDEARNTPEARAIIFRGLLWLGLEWDEGPLPDGTQKGELGPYNQSERTEIHKAYIQKLLDSGAAYIDEKDGATRFRLPKEERTVPDLICGEVTVDLSAQPDITIARKDGKPTFHLVNVVDDLEMKITHVIRGEDHLTNTAKHLALAEALEATPPQYAHIPLILTAGGKKMSKRDEGSSIGEYIDAGYLPEAVRNYLCLLGWSPKDNTEVMPIEEVVERFDLPQVNRSNARFDIDKLFWINGVYYSNLPLDVLDSLARQALAKAGVSLVGVDPDYFQDALRICQEKTKSAGELPAWMDFFFDEEFPYDEKASKKHFTPDGLKVLRELRGLVASTGETTIPVTDDTEEISLPDYSSFTDAVYPPEPFSAGALEDHFLRYSKVHGLKMAHLVHPTRLAISGKPVGPSLYPMMEVMGKERVLRRIDRTLAKFGSGTEA